MSRFIPQYTSQAKQDMLAAALDAFDEKMSSRRAYLERAASEPSDENIINARKAVVDVSTFFNKDVIPLLNHLSPVPSQDQKKEVSLVGGADLSSVLG